MEAKPDPAARQPFDYGHSIECDLASDVLREFLPRDDDGEGGATAGGRIVPLTPR